MADETLEISAITEDEELRHKIRLDSENFLVHEKQIFTDIVYTDALLVAAKGIVLIEFMYKKKILFLLFQELDMRSHLFA